MVKKSNKIKIQRSKVISKKRQNSSNKKSTKRIKQVKSKLPDVIQKYPNKNTKIICTIGPSSWDAKILNKLYENGMDCVRINTAHEDISFYPPLIKKVKANMNVPIMVDIKGPELRIRTPETVRCNKGQLLEFYGKSKTKLHFNYDMISSLNEGDTILIADGKYVFKVVEKYKDKVIARSEQDCDINPNKNMHLPNKVINLPSLTKKDKEAIKMSIKEKVDYIALSFCRSKKDVLNLRRLLKDSGIKIIAKIENHEGIANIDEIIDSADGIMVARGDLGVEFAPGKVPIIQKKIIKKCNANGKLVIVATEMLETMIRNSQPTRAEISDIANAVLDGADCIMLSAETAIGKYPVKAVEYMSKTAINIEPVVEPANIAIGKEDYNMEHMTPSEAISLSVKGLCNEIDFDKIVCLTYEGHTAQRISRFRINKPIIALTSTEQLARQLMLYYGVHPLHIKENFWDPSTRAILKDLYFRGVVGAKDYVLMTAGLYTLKERNTNTNTIHIHKMEDLLTYLKRKKQL